jgi:hypothetical protein
MNGRTFSSSLLQALAPKPLPNSISPSNADGTPNKIDQSLTPTSTSNAASNMPLYKISLEIPIMTPDKLYPTPSMSDNLPYDVEFDLRLVGCELIQTAGQLLKMPQVIFYLIFTYLYFIIFIYFYLELNLDCYGNWSSFVSSLLLYKIFC